LIFCGLFETWRDIALACLGLSSLAWEWVVKAPSFYL
jgi:hypothetical protein